MKEFLPKVVATTPADIADVVVADNGSSDGSRALLAEKFPEVKTIVFDKNYGYASAVAMCLLIVILLIHLIQTLFFKEKDT